MPLPDVERQDAPMAVQKQLGYKLLVTEARLSSEFKGEGFALAEIRK